MEERVNKIRIRLCSVSPEYIDKLQAVDSRVGSTVMYNVRNINAKLYAIPFRFALEDCLGFEEKIKADALPNALDFAGMFPVKESVLIESDASEDVQMFVSMFNEEIAAKAADIYMRRYNKTDEKYDVISKLCCDYKALEKFVDEKDS